MGGGGGWSSSEVMLLTSATEPRLGLMAGRGAKGPPRTEALPRAPPTPPDMAVAAAAP